LTAGSNTLTQTLVVAQNSLSEMSLSMSTQLHLFRTPRKPQVSSTATGSPKVAQSAKQASFRVTLLCASLLRERTSQDLVRVHCCYWSMVVLHSSGDLPVTRRSHFWFSIFPMLDFFLVKKKIVLDWGDLLPRTGGKEG
jgi:hypothetical protein